MARVNTVPSYIEPEPEFNQITVDGSLSVEPDGKPGAIPFAGSVEQADFWLRILDREPSENTQQKEEVDDMPT